MYRLSALPTLLLLSACAGPIPQPDPDRAWIDLYTTASNVLMAQKLDGRTWADGRYYEVTPGSHTLEVSFTFDLPDSGGARGIGDNTRTCTMALEYSSFSAGQRYQLKAGKQGLRPWLRLADAKNQIVARGETLRCPAY